MIDVYKLAQQYIELHEYASKARVVVVGDFMLDQYTWCEDKWPASNEALVLEEQKQHCYPGGAGNICLNLFLLGLEVHPCGVVGKDPQGQLLLQLLKGHMNTEFILAQDGGTTTLKNRLLSANGKPRVQPLRVDRKSWFHLPEPERNRFRQNVIQAILSSDYVILSDYNQGILFPELIEMILAESKKSNKAVHIDSRGKDIKKYRGASMLMSTLTEINHLIGTSCSDLEELIPPLLIAKEENSIENVVVKHNKFGSMLLSGGSVMYAEPFVKEVNCTVGAGDSFLAGFVSARAIGMTEIDSYLIGNMFAGIAVSQPETYAVTFQDLIKYMCKEDDNWKIKRWNDHQKAFERT